MMVSPLVPIPLMQALPPSADDLRFGSETNRILGTFKARWDGAQAGRLDTLELRAGGHLGQRGGYASLKDAVDSLSQLTAGNPASAAVILDNGRYYGYQIKERDLKQGINAPLKTSVFEPTNGKVSDLRTVQRDETLVALVDGRWAHKFLV